MAWVHKLGWQLGGKNVSATIAIVGLHNSGKSTIMTQLKPREESLEKLSPGIPLGLHAERFTSGALTFVAFDLGDLSGFGNPWEDFYRDCHGVVFIVDSGDRMNMPAVRTQLDKLLRHALLRDRALPLLVLANKMDNPSAVSGIQLADMLGLNQVRTRPWQVYPCDALTGEGLHEALDWLANQLRRICKVT